MFTVQCMRCDGAGKYDRGACFCCKGLGIVNQKTRPRALTPFIFTVTYSNGSKNFPKIWATSRGIAVSIIDRHLKIKGWEGIVE